MPKYQAKRPPSLAVARESFRGSFGRLVLDVFLFRHHENPESERVARLRLNHPSLNGARLHTVPFNWIRDEAVGVFDRPSDNVANFEMWTQSFVEAGLRLVRDIQAVIREVRAGRTIRGYRASDLPTLEDLLDRVMKNCREFNAARVELIFQGRANQVRPETVREFVREANNYIGNVYNIGAHEGVNIQLSYRLHLNFTTHVDRHSLTPNSRVHAQGVTQAMRDGSTSIAVPLTPRGTRIVGHHAFVPADLLTPRSQDILSTAPVERVAGVSAVAMAGFRQYIVEPPPLRAPPQTTTPAVRVTGKRARGLDNEAELSPVQRAATSRQRTGMTESQQVNVQPVENPFAPSAPELGAAEPAAALAPLNPSAPEAGGGVMPGESAPLNASAADPFEVAMQRRYAQLDSAPSNSATVDAESAGEVAPAVAVEADGAAAATRVLALL